MILVVVCVCFVFCVVCLVCMMDDYFDDLFVFYVDYGVLFRKEGLC